MPVRMVQIVLIRAGGLRRIVRPWRVGRINVVLEGSGRVCARVVRARGWDLAVEQVVLIPVERGRVCVRRMRGVVERRAGREWAVVIGSFGLVAGRGGV